MLYMILCSDDDAKRAQRWERYVCMCVRSRWCLRARGKTGVFFRKARARVTLCDLNLNTNAKQLIGLSPRT